MSREGPQLRGKLWLTYLILQRPLQQGLQQTLFLLPILEMAVENLLLMMHDFGDAEMFQLDKQRKIAHNWVYA